MSPATSLAALKMNTPDHFRPGVFFGSKRVQIHSTRDESGARCLPILRELVSDQGLSLRGRYGCGRRFHKGGLFGRDGFFFAEYDAVLLVGIHDDDVALFELVGKEFPR